MARVPVRPRSVTELASLTSPVSIPAGQSEAIRWQYYDTQTYLQAGSSALTFFQTVSNDVTLSNMEAQGQLPDPKYLELWFVSCDILLPKASAAVPNAAGDMLNLVMIGRPIFTLTISDKVYIRTPLSFLHASGGVDGFGYSVAAVAATAAEWANNGVQDGGYCVDGSIIIPPKVGFQASIAWGNAQAVLADTRIRINLDGVLHRRVL